MLTCLVSLYIKVVFHMGGPTKQVDLDTIPVGRISLSTACNLSVLASLRISCIPKKYFGPSDQVFWMLCRGYRFVPYADWKSVIATFGKDP